eukprot:423541_1
MVIYCIQSSQNTYYHQNQLINDDDDELINSYGFASVGIMNGHPSNQRLNIEDENVPFNALVLIVSNILILIPLEVVFYDLMMYGNLNVNNFIEMLTEYTFTNIIISLKYHKNLTRQDCINRLDTINWMLLNNNKLTEYIDNIFINNMCDILNNNKFNDVISMSSKVLMYGISRKRKANVKDALISIQDILTDDSFRHFTEFYFDLLNNIDYDNVENSNEELELLIEFNAFVFRYNLYTFYFTSDIKILIDIYLRAFHNCEPSSKQLLLCLDGLYNIIRWKNYSKINILNKYKSNELLNILTNELK